ncbi:biotin-dependent carboxyltransferase family protein [Acaricomes phytoseiuli]|nr:biotin-dependent carboxyltransferase family protein [Acaricomes phytoseiuli]MCW1250389.1 biotin-dependent carboxyltransferase family protein [Acaricomes phytoseiuli]
MSVANQMLGNPWDATVLEILSGGFNAVFEQPARISVTGASGPFFLDGKAVSLNTPLPVSSGSNLEIGHARAGMRFYLAIRGGFHADSFAGSAARDTLAGMGPPPVVAGDLLGTGLPAGDFAVSAPAAVPLIRLAPAGEQTAAVRVTPGPRLDWFTSESRQRLLRQPWEVSAESNRIGIRLSGRPLHLAREQQLPSEGVVTGAVQVPPSGLPVIFHADRPVTGGYPVIAVVAAADLDVLAQLRPGQRLRFLSGTR